MVKTADAVTIGAALGQGHTVGRETGKKRLIKLITQLCPPGHANIHHRAKN